MELVAPTKNAFVIDQSPISVTTEIQEGSPKIKLEPSTPPSKLTTARLDFSAPAHNVPVTEAVKGTDKIIISLCDGIGGGAAALVAAGVNNVTQYIGVENDPIAREIAKHANPMTSTFPGINHGWHKDVTNVTEADIAAFPTDSVVGLIAGTPCGDFTSQPSIIHHALTGCLEEAVKRRKKGPPQGLNGKHGSLFRTAIQIWKWVKIHHPHATCFFENMVFDDMEDDWEEVNETLGKPLVINSMDYSTTDHNRAYWTNHAGVKADPNRGMADTGPIDPSSCMNDDRRISTYVDKGVTKVRPLGTWWGGDPEKPQANSNCKVWVHDPNHPETPQDLHVTEAEKLYGMEADQTAAPGVSPLERIRCISAGWDINIVKMLFGTIFRSDARYSQPRLEAKHDTWGGYQVPMDIQNENNFSYSAAMRIPLNELLTKEGCTIHMDQNIAFFPGGEVVMIYFNRNEVSCYDGPGYLCDDSRIYPGMENMHPWVPPDPLK